MTTWLRALLLCVSMCTGCAAAQNSADDGQALKASVMEFHRNLRWSRYEFAAQHVDPKFREAFLGRYEELGDDYHLVQLEIKKLEMTREEDKPVATIEVEEKWYREPNMVVKTDRVIERWERIRDGWLIVERMEKDEWKAREKERAKPANSPTTATPVQTPTEPAPAVDSADAS
jgi:hypothetical protein